MSVVQIKSLCAPCSGGDWIAGEPTEREIRQLQKARFEELGAAA